MVKKINKKCNIVALASDLVSKAWAKELPDDFEPGDLSDDQILANIRHEYTNYQELLQELPLCVDFENQAYCKKIIGRGYLDGDECPLLQEAHDVIKWGAKEKAEQVYSSWLEKKKKNN